MISTDVDLTGTIEAQITTERTASAADSTNSPFQAPAADNTARAGDMRALTDVDVTAREGDVGASVQCDVISQSGCRVEEMERCVEPGYCGCLSGFVRREDTDKCVG